MHKQIYNFINLLLYFVCHIHYNIHVGLEWTHPDINDNYVRHKLLQIYNNYYYTLVIGCFC